MIEPVAEALGNTEAMSRKSYVHPGLVDAVKDDSRDPLDGLERPRAKKRLSSAEVALIDYLGRKTPAQDTQGRLSLDRKELGRHKARRCKP